MASAWAALTKFCEAECLSKCGVDTVNSFQPPLWDQNNYTEYYEVGIYIYYYFCIAVNTLSDQKLPLYRQLPLEGHSQ